MARKTIPITCPNCGESQSETVRGFDPDKRQVVCGNCGYILTLEEVKASLSEDIRDMVEELKTRLQPKD